MQFGFILCFTAFAGVWGTPEVTPDASIVEPLEIFNDRDISQGIWNASRIAPSNYCVAEHNKYRAKHGLDALAADSRLEAAARFHNKEMVRQNCYSHQCGDEPGLADRITKQGYKPWSGVAENIHKGPADCNEALDGWVNSKGHKKNLLGKHRHIGCHMLKKHFTCVFAKP